MSGLTVASECITVELSGSRKEVPKQILADVNFLARPGEMTAIMGPSGCGKTTFLNVLSNRQSRNCKVSGRVIYDGKDTLMPYVSNFTAYVMQEDYFLQRLTVRETLVFAARLRISNKSYSEQVAVAEEIMQRLGLDLCADVLIGGSELKGISGGQRKRVSIAVALLDNPKVIYLDEPTSGLDAALAFDVVATLRVLAKHYKKTVIATIHQPRAEVYAMFDSLLLMRAGKVIFHGPCLNALDFFGSIGFPCPDDYNAADFFLDLLTEKVTEADDDEDDNDNMKGEQASLGALEASKPSSSLESSLSSQSQLASEDRGWVSDSNQFEECSKSAEKKSLTIATSSLVGRIQVTAEQADFFADQFKATDEAKRIQQDIKDLPNKPSEADSDDLLRSPNRRDGLGPTCFRYVSAVYILWLRGVREGSRRPEFIYVNFAQALILGFVVCTLYYKSAKPDPSLDGCDYTVGRNLIGGMMQCISNTSFTSFDAAILHINRRPLVNREASGGLYPRTAALIASWMSDGLYHYTSSLLYGMIFYWIIDLKHSFKAYCIWFLFLWALKFGFWGSSTAIGALAKNPAGGMGMIPMTNVLLFMVSGYQMNDAGLSRGLRWLSDISPIRYCWQGVVRSQLDPDNTGYVERCYGFTTPGSWFTCWGYAMVYAAVARTLAVIFTQFLHKNQGVQA